MPDISMCTGYDPATNIFCPMRQQCYRYTAKPTEYWQAYFAKAPFINKLNDITCEYYWHVESKSKYKRMEIQTK